MRRIDKISKAYGDRVVLNAISFHFPTKERIALVGANGQGKTTLLNIICGIDYADEGKIISPTEMHFAFLPQSPSENPQPTILQECLSRFVLREAHILNRTSPQKYSSCI